MYNTYEKKENSLGLYYFAILNKVSNILQVTWETRKVFCYFKAVSLLLQIVVSENDPSAAHQ